MQNTFRFWSVTILILKPDYSIIGIKADMAENISTRKVESAFERIVYSYQKHWGGFKVDNLLFYVLR